MLNIKFSDQAIESLNALYMYCSEYFGERTAQNVRVKYNDTILILANFPYIGMEENNNCRSFPVKKRGRVIYRIEKDTLHIVDIWDMRMDREFLENRIK